MLYVPHYQLVHTAQYVHQFFQHGDEAESGADYDTCLSTAETGRTQEILRIIAQFRDGERAVDHKLSADTYTNEFTWLAARLSVGGILSAIDALMAGSIANAFTIMRPPGHHCGTDTPMGFCVLSNIAIAARYAVQKHGCRVAIVDWDVHDGNGTYAALEEHSDEILFISLHRYERGMFYPGTGSLTRGRREGRGKLTVNIPWEQPGMGDAEYLAAFDLIVIPILTEFAPDLVLVSCGFDAAAGDPLGGMKVTPSA